MAAIRALLSAEALPTADLTVTSPRFVVACVTGDEIVGVGAFQSLGDCGLLRSVAVAPSFRGAGLGQRIVERLEAVARDNGLKQLGLLTLTAKEFFERRGYRVIAREDMPAALRGTEEFRTLCPASAVCMTKFISDS